MPGLLLLRVFGHQSRTERLFDFIARQWRFRGPVQLIAGADLAMRTVDPGDVLAFVSGRLRPVRGVGHEIPGRIARLDMRPDPDGRFRINELYCLHDTWKTTLQTLLSVTDMVVMDLRGFSRQSKGCLYELPADRREHRDRQDRADRRSGHRPGAARGNAGPGVGAGPLVRPRRS